MRYEISLLTPSEARIPDIVLPVWFDPRWMEGMAGHFGFKAQVLACWRGEQLTTLLPIYEKQVLTYRRAVIPMLNYYQPLCHMRTAEKPNRAMLNQLETTREIALRLKKYYRKVNLSLHPDNYDVRGFSWEGYNALPRYTMYYDPAQAAALFKDEKNALRRAERQGYRFVQQFDPQCFSDLLYAMYQRKKVDFPIAAPALEAYLTEMQAHQLIRQYNVTKDGQIVSANIVICDREVAYTWMRASDENELKTGVSVFHSVELYAELSKTFKVIDMCGANTASTARFKTGMGGQLRIFFHIST